jgi:UDP-2,4-diacetamido-2,4,6-trideoxy-beta-L-altropyranose hydrolase
MAASAPTIMFRVDSSTALGAGHLTRCLALAEELRSRGAMCRFACADLPGALVLEASVHGFGVDTLPATTSENDDAAATLDATPDGCLDAMVVDVYRLGAAWERAMRPSARRLLAIDDLANRQHDCDLLLDQTYTPDGNRRYDGLVPAGCRVLTGPSFALVRDEFARAAAVPQNRDGLVRRVLVFFGGGDATNETMKAIAALDDPRLAGISADVVVGEANPHRQDIARAVAGLSHIRLHERGTNMSSLMAAADVALGAAGMTSLERCALGLPSILVSVADNQRSIAANLASANAAIDLGFYTSVTAEGLADALAGLAADSGRVRAISRAARGICGATLKGSAAVADALLSPSPWGCRLRAMTRDDLELVRSWRNSPHVRAHMFTSQIIAGAEHKAWFEDREGDSTVRQLVFESAGRPLGFVGLSSIVSGEACNWGFYIGESCRPHGTATELGTLALDYAFRSLGVRVVRAEVLESNRASRQYHASLGFREVAQVPPHGHEGSRVRRLVRFEMSLDRWKASVG